MDRRLQNEVTKRIEDLEKKGLLSSKMTEHYKMALVKARSNPLKFKKFAELVQKDLDRIQNQNGEASPAEPSPTASTYSSGSSTSVSAFTEIASAANSNASSGVRFRSNASFNRPDKSKGADPAVMAKQAEKKVYRPAGFATKKPAERLLRAVENRNVFKGEQLVGSHAPQRQTRENNSPMVVDVADFPSQVGEEKKEELFVEMCFFARLGYVQPPCCLRCTYREALKDGNAQTECPRWVIWRKDTTQLLHPNQLEGNLLMVQCRAARRLLSGKRVDGYVWSADRQEVYQDAP